METASMERTPIILMNCLSLIYALFLVCKGMIKYTSNGCDEQYRDLVLIRTYQFGREARVSEGGGLSVGYDTRQDD